MMYIVPAPYAHRTLIGSASSYFIHDGYLHREEVPHFDDTPFENEFQKEIYLYARQIAVENKFSKIVDFGCGSGFKLMTNFFEFDTLGIDVSETVSFCFKKWVGRRWMTTDMLTPPFEAKPDLIICADVIEHLLHPNRMLHFFRTWKPKRLILSTPAREQLSIGTDNGPPKNIHHAREWSVAEFHAYIGAWFKIREHFVINGSQCVDAESLEG